MTQTPRSEWEYATSSLRKLLSGYNSGETNMNGIAEYRFGSVWNPMFGFFHVWDGLLEVGVEGSMPGGTIATIRPGDTARVRFDPNSDFRYEIQKFLMPPKTTFVASETLRRHDHWVGERIHNTVHSLIRERADFLEQERLKQALRDQSSSGMGRISQFVMRVPVLASIQERFIGRPIDVTETDRIDVIFEEEPSVRLQERVRMAIMEMENAGEPIRPGTYTEREIREIQERWMRQQEMERIVRERSEDILRTMPQINYERWLEEHHRVSYWQQEYLNGIQELEDT